MRPVVLAVAAGLALAAPLHASAQEDACVPVARWVSPAVSAPVDAATIIARAARQSVVLLGERHDNVDDHRWQLNVLAALHAQQPNIVIALEMFPRRVQPALDRWVRGALTEAAFLEAADWRGSWGFDAALYMPIFDFARMHRLPMVAANVERSLISAVGKGGLDSVPADKREGVGRAAAPRDRYVTSLAEVYTEHQPADKRGKPPTLADAEFRRFVEAQTLWDRAMAEAIAAALKARPGALVVGIVGRGHVEFGDGVAHQLRDLGVADTMLLLPWDRDMSCKSLVPGIADAVFGVASLKAPAAPSRPRLGVSMETANGEVRIQSVTRDSIAAASGLRDGDVLLEVAGKPVKQSGDVADAVRRQAPGTWLPIVVRRGGERIEIVARFPAGQ
jgi:uncharacterized iron-regulated protein